jgi:alpha-N-arabinofuranosidase
MNMKKINLLMTACILTMIVLTVSAQKSEIILKPSEANDTISRYIYGHFAEHLGRCIYGGLWVGKDSEIPNTRGIRNDVVDALKEIKVPVIRWPGGCFADLYQWKDGIGPLEERKPVVNQFWGGELENNSFGTHEFLDLCEMLDAEAYLAVNVGSGTVEDAYDWVEYVTSDGNGPMPEWRRANGREEPWDVKFWGIGNENWGCGGNMSASYYASLFKRFSTYCWAEYKIASCGLPQDFEWTETIMRETNVNTNLINGYSYHHYTVSNTWAEKGSATDFDEKDWFNTVSKNMAMEENLVQHMAIMDQFDPDENIGLIADEWGNWHDVQPGTNPGFLYQQNTIRDAVTASIYLNVFNKHCRRVKMANIAQMVNVLQAMVLTQEEKMVKTPTFYVFKMYTVHHDALLIPTEIKTGNYTFNNQNIPAISASASQNDAGQYNITLTNIDPNEAISTTMRTEGENEFRVVKAEIITAEKMNDYNNFGKEEKVNIKSFSNYKVNNNNITLELPSKAVVLLTLAKK